MAQSLKVAAGSLAYRLIKDGGLKPGMVDIVAGAAGGPKWLILGGLDRFLFGSWFGGRTRPLYLAGSSIGSWRFAAAATENPLETIDLFEEEYIHQRYSSPGPDPSEVSRVSLQIMERYLGGKTREVMSHPFIRLSVFTVRSRGVFAREGRHLLPSFGGAFLLNALDRDSLNMFFTRTVFHDPRDVPPFLPLNDMKTETADLTVDNLIPALQASGSIPLVMEGVRDIPGAKPGTYRDGGLVDYQMDIPWRVAPDRVILYPHFISGVIPGWLDKHLPWRRGRENLSSTVLLYPSPEWVRTLPAGKIPDRTDFARWNDADRIKNWQLCVKAAGVLAEEFNDLVASEGIRREVTGL